MDKKAVDLLWELVEAAQEVGWHRAQFRDEPLVETFAEAYEVQVRLMSQVFLRMERISEDEFDEIMKLGG
jgi:hypothetical protein